MSTPQIIVTTPGDKRLARCAWPETGFEQSDPFESEPIYIVVPKTATALAIDRVARRFGVEREKNLAKRSEPWTPADAIDERLVGLTSPR